MAFIYDETANSQLELSEIENDTINYNMYSIVVKPSIEAIFSLHQKKIILNL